MLSKGCGMGKEFVYLPHHLVMFSHTYIVDGGVSAHEERRWMYVSLACSRHSGARGDGNLVGCMVCYVV